MGSRRDAEREESRRLLRTCNYSVFTTLSVSPTRGPGKQRQVLSKANGPRLKAKVMACSYLSRQANKAPCNH